MTKKISKKPSKEFLRGLREAMLIAFDIEIKYIPSRNDPCCKCAVSHAKADGAADVATIIQRRIDKLSK